jgi:hypothetical protein
MRKRFLMAPGLVLCLAGAAAAEDFPDPMYGIRGPNGLDRELGVVEGKVRLVHGDATGRDWTFQEDGDKGFQIQLKNGKWRGWFLTCDHTGKAAEVFITEKPAPGSYWKLTRVKAGEPAAYTIQAAAGKFAGWYLDVAGEAEQQVDSRGKPYIAYRVTLTEKPRPIPKFTIETIAP